MGQAISSFTLVKYREETAAPAPQRYSRWDELVAIHDRIAETDRALKSGAPGDVVMPVLIAAIAA